MIHRMIPYKSIISIHALREEGDSPSGCAYCYRAISIHALREEGDYHQLFNGKQYFQFLSTPSARRATRPVRCLRWHSDISIHALREEGDSGPLLELRRQSYISIHALREEGDPDRRTCASVPNHFYPRPPRGGRRSRPWCGSGRSYFYPRPPRGGRPTSSISLMAASIFLSTPSARRATPMRPSVPMP